MAKGPGERDQLGDVILPVLPFKKDLVSHSFKKVELFNPLQEGGKKMSRLMVLEERISVKYV